MSCSTSAPDHPHVDWSIQLDDLGRSVAVAAISGALIVTVGNVALIRSVAAVSQLRIAGGLGDDVVRIDATAYAALPITVEGGAGTDALHGPAVDLTWSITTPGGGSAGTLTSPGSRTWSARPATTTRSWSGVGGSITGTIEGGDGGYDVIEVVDRWRGPHLGDHRPAVGCDHP